MNPKTLISFVDEMVKISEFDKTAAGRQLINASRMKRGVEAMKRLGKKGVKSIREGWEYGSDIPGHGWLGAGYQAPKDAGLLHKGFEGVTSLGGLTKYLPVGPKSMTLGFTAASLPGALRKEDPSGEGRSRVERMGGVLGGTVAGLAGARTGIIPSVAIGMAGDYAGSRLGRLVSPRRPGGVPPPAYEPFTRRRFEAVPMGTQTAQPPVAPTVPAQ